MHFEHRRCFEWVLWRWQAFRGSWYADRCLLLLGKIAYNSSPCQCFDGINSDFLPISQFPCEKYARVFAKSNTCYNIDVIESYFKFFSKIRKIWKPCKVLFGNILSLEIFFFGIREIKFVIVFPAVVYVFEGIKTNFRLFFLFFTRKFYKHKKHEKHKKHIQANK